MKVAVLKKFLYASVAIFLMAGGLTPALHNQHHDPGHHCSICMAYVMQAVSSSLPQTLDMPASTWTIVRASEVAEPARPASSTYLSRAPPSVLHG